jgi:cytochrome c-type biogenesis protein CcmH
MNRVRLVVITLAVAVAVAVVVALGATTPVFAQSAKSSLTDPDEAAMFNRISDALVCQCGCSMILRQCNHFECPSAIPMRKKIEEQILAGTSEETIIAGFVEEYGKVVLSTPPPEGVDLAAWVMPGFAILIGLFVLSYFVADQLTKRKVKAPEPPAPDPSVVKRIEQELKTIE